MAKTTGISWCDSTFNPWIGCTRVGPGCDHCYAEVMDSRKRWDGGKTHWGAGVPRYRTSESNWKQPIKWNASRRALLEDHLDERPWRVFCSSLADVFDNEVQQGWRADLWDLIAETQNLSWLLVTKRIGNVRGMVPIEWLQDSLHPERDGFPPNVRILITVCNQDEADRDIPKLLALNCKNGVSYEPALGPIEWNTWPDRQWLRVVGVDGCATRGKIEWIIVGGESGSKARPFDLSWARSTVAQCKAAGVPVFIKQLGRYPMPESDDLCGHRSKGHSFYRGSTLRYCDEDERISVDLKDRAGADPVEWPDDLRVQQFPT